jgi:CheY-like chemotaxis protein
MGDTGANEGPRIVRDLEWSGWGFGPHPARSPRAYAFAIEDARKRWLGSPDSRPRTLVDASGPVRFEGWSGRELLLLSRLVVEATEVGLITDFEAAMCLSLNEERYRVVRRRMWDLGCACEHCTRVSAASGPDASRADAGGDGTVARPLRVVVVDDEIGVRKFLARATRDAIRGVEVVEGDSGFDAITLRFADTPPDLMFVNGAMPGLDGMEAIHEIRSREREDCDRVPIVFESIWPAPSLGPGFAACVDAWLEKPFQRTQVQEVLTRFLEPSQGE